MDCPLDSVTGSCVVEELQVWTVSLCRGIVRGQIVMKAGDPDVGPLTSTDWVSTVVVGAAEVYGKGTAAAFTISGMEHHA
jgi:hypothetical protein